MLGHHVIELHSEWPKLSATEFFLKKKVQHKRKHDNPNTDHKTKVHVTGKCYSAVLSYQLPYLSDTTRNTSYFFGHVH